MMLSDELFYIIVRRPLICGAILRYVSVFVTQLRTVLKAEEEAPGERVFAESAT